MFEANSRYYQIEEAKFTAADGRVIVYKKRRILPLSSTMQLAAEVKLVQGERLDLISSRLLGDPEQFWQICDSNDAMNPKDLTTVPGRILKVSMPRI